MDRDQTQYGSLGFIGIFRETFRLIFTGKRIFSQIALALILPLCILYLAYIKVTELISGATFTNTYLGAYIDNNGTGEIQVFKGVHEPISFYFFNAVYLNFVLLFSTLSTSAVVYTIACIYSNKDLTFRKVMNAVPKPWERLLATFLWSCFIYFIFSAIYFSLLSICAYLLSLNTVFGIVLLIAVFIGVILACAYTTVICQTTFVVYVLEDDYGRNVIARGRALAQGKTGAAMGCYLVLVVPFVLVALIFVLFVSTDIGGDLGILLRILIGIAILVVEVFLYLVLLVCQTMNYFVCKSYHNEHIDGPALARHLEGLSQIKDAQHQPVSNV